MRYYHAIPRISVHKVMQDVYHRQQGQKCQLEIPGSTDVPHLPIDWTASGYHPPSSRAQLPIRNADLGRLESPPPV